MNIIFDNRNRFPVIIKINDLSFITLQSHETKSVKVHSNNLEILLKHSYESYMPKGWTIYNLVIDSKYTISGFKENEVFYIDREKIRFDIDVSYDKLFITSQNSTILSEVHNVSAEEKMKKSFARRKILHRFVIEPIEQSTGLTIVLLIIGAIISFLIGIKFALIYFPAVYIFLVLVNWCIDKFVGSVLKLDESAERFYSYFNSDFIKAFFANPDRKSLIDEDFEIN